MSLAASACGCDALASDQLVFVHLCRAQDESAVWVCENGRAQLLADWRPALGATRDMVALGVSNFQDGCVCAFAPPKGQHVLLIHVQNNLT
jgi:hypothetical protein